MSRRSLLTSMVSARLVPPVRSILRLCAEAAASSSRLSNFNLRNRPAGEMEDPVLRHRQAQRGRAWQSGIEAAHDSRDDAVGHRDDRPSVLLGEPGGDPGGEIVIGFAVGGTEIPFVPTIAVENSRGERGDLAAVEPAPRTDRDFAQALVEPQARGAAQTISSDLAADNLGGAPRPADRAGDDFGRSRFAQGT